MTFNNNLLFYIMSSITNFGLISLSVIFSGLITEEYIISGIFLTQKIGGADFIFLKKIYLFLAFLFPYLIYVVKNYKYHGLLIFLISVLLIILRQSFYYFKLPNDYYFLFRAFKETFVLMLITSIAMHFLQKLIGEKLLPIKYNKIKCNDT